MEDYTQRWAEIATKSVDEQSKYFLRSFVLDFQGRFEEVLDIAEQFKNYAPSNVQRSTFGELPEFECHLFLEKRGETLTVKALRENLKAEIKLGAHHNVAFIEYLLWKYHKNLAQLFTPPPAGTVSAELLAALDRAIEAYLASKEEERIRQEEIARLKDAAEGKRTVASVQAKNKMEELQGKEFAQKFKEMQALKAKKEAEKAVAEAPKVDPYVEEQKRLEAERKAKEEAEKKAQQEARNRLKARAALWEGK
ncbi:Cell envelope integrity inner membrane protein TolA [Balamuthia mandrillaris]